VDTLRLLFETKSHDERRFEIDLLPGWQFGSIPSLGLTWAEGHPARTEGALATAEEVAGASMLVRAALDERLGVMRERGVGRSDQTVTTRFERPQEARAFLSGMAAVQLPRTQTTRRGHPVQSVWWTAPNGARKLARAYDKSLEATGTPFGSVRLEDQRRYPSGARPPAEVVADGHYLRGKFEARFGPVRKAVDGVKAATFPVVAQALADEARYGYRSIDEAERLAGALVLLTGGAGDTYKAERRATYYRRQAELREAGFVVVDDLAEVVEVDLGEVVEAALEADGWR
jgi:hypothetical protein